jgi:hypothetical protein
MGLMSTRRSAKKEGSSKARPRQGRAWKGHEEDEAVAAALSLAEERGGRDVLLDLAR